MKREIDAFLDRLAGFQFRHAGVVLFVSVLLAAGSLPLVMQLGLDSAFVALLPETKPSVQDLREVEDRVGGLQTLTVAIQSKDLDAMQRFTKELVPRLEKDLDPEIVRSVDWNIGTYEDFVYEHRHLYADIDDLLDARDDLEERIDFEKLKDNPFYVRLDDHEPPEIQTTIDRIKKKADEGKEEIAKYPGGYYVHSDNDLLVVFVRSNLKGGDAAGAARLIAQIDEHVHDLGTSNYAPDLVVEYAGSLVIIREEHEALAREMVLAVSITIALVLLAIYIFFRRIRAPFLLGGAMVTPVLMSFATGELTVDYLNTSTVFLGSIVIGNGVNPNIIWLARYFEERRRGREVLDSLERAHHGTWVATLTASAAAGPAYGSLIITDFRGFADFGIIGGAGMILCWFGAYFILPALTALVERIKPLTYTEKEKNRKPLYGLLFARMVYARPKLIVALSALLGAVVVTDGAVVGEGFNRVLSTNDPTAHAEVTAIRDASARLRRFDLSGCEIYVIGVPCPMCMAAIFWARIDRIHTVLKPEDAEDIGFDDKLFYEELDKPLAARTVPVVEVPELRDEARAIYDLWPGRADKTPY